MNINRNNYESYFLDYLDGRLDAGQVEVLMSFLEFNSDLKQELMGIENLSLEPEDVRFEWKSTLRKPQSNPDRKLVLKHFEDYCISSIEQQLSLQEENLLQEITLGDPERKKNYRLYQSTLIKADPGIVYPYKGRLRKRYIQLPGVGVALFSVAASAVILLALSLFLRNPSERIEISNHPVPPTDQMMRETPETLEKSAMGSSGEIIDRSANTNMNTVILSNISPIAPVSADGLGLPDIAGQVIRPAPILLTRIEPIFPDDLGDAGNMDMSRFSAEISQPASWNQQLYSLESSKLRRERRNEKIKLSIWNIADAGINKINELTEEPYSIEQQTDDQGKIRRFTIETPLFGISAPLRNPHNPR